LARHESTIQMYTNLCFKTVTSTQIAQEWDAVTQFAGAFAQGTLGSG
jgi:hypothetical protein